MLDRQRYSGTFEVDEMNCGRHQHIEKLGHAPGQRIGDHRLGVHARLGIHADGVTGSRNSLADQLVRHHNSGCIIGNIARPRKVSRSGMRGLLLDAGIP